jgi:ankyrin repeat protein
MLERITNGRTDLVFEYLENGNPATAVVEGIPLIRWCAYYGDVSAIRFLISKGASLSALGENLDLNGAAFHGHWRLCEYLIENGADVNRELPETGETPLHATLSKANRWKYTPLVKLLLARGADPNRATIAGRETGSFMRDCRTKGETPLHRAAAFGNEEDIEALIAAGARLDALDANGDSPLSWASWYLRPGAVLGLLCYTPFRIHPARRNQRTCEPATGSMEPDLLGRPVLDGKTRSRAL